MRIADLLLPLDENSDVPLHRQLYEGLRDAILSGRLPPGTRIPSTRRLAEYLAVSRTTVLTAFDRLAAEGFLEAEVGSGSRVSEHLPVARARDARGAAARGDAARRDARSGAARRGAAGADAARDDIARGDRHPPTAARDESRAHRSVGAGAAGASSPVEALSRCGRSLIELPRPQMPRSPGPLPFRTGQPPVDGFPLEMWRRLAARCHRSLSTADLYHGAPAGLERLREAIVTVALARGIECDAEQVIVLSSAQEGMELVCRMLLDPDDEAWIEDPGWMGARAALLAAGARPVPVPVDGAGMQVEAGALAAPRARLAYVTPSHQYPMGVTMSEERRRGLLSWAEQNGSWILEDDYDSEFRYTDRPLPALYGLDRSERVIYVGTFNKTLFPAVRLAYLIVPESLVGPFRSARGIGGQHAPVADQAVLSDFISEGHYARHIRQVRVLGRERRDALLSALSDCGLDFLEILHADAGLHTVAWLPAEASDRALSDAALELDVEAAPLSAFYEGPCPRPGLVLGYGSLATEQIRDGAARLAEASARLASG